MTEVNRRSMVTGGDALHEDVMVLSESLQPRMDVELEREKLRQRWELASVLNFLKVFEPVIRSGLKISAEEIETALIKQNDKLAQLHVALLKGILPLSKGLNSSDVWMITLTNKLAMWWPWVAEGDFPLNGSKGEEISNYKKLDPTTRLLILKALCEVRADQFDAVSYINETIKSGSKVSTFRKDKLAGDGNGIAFWYDGNETIGHRLYKEVCLFETEQVKGKGAIPAIIFHWETIATNLEEFQKVAGEFSSSKVQWKVALSESVEANVIPVLKKQWQKKQRAHQRQQRQHLLLNGFRSSGVTRSCRNQRPVDYRFDDYDRAITEAIQYANKRKTREEQRHEEKHSQSGKRMVTTSTEANNSNTNSRDSESTDSDFEKSSCQGSDSTDDSSHREYNSEEIDSDNEKGERNHGQIHSRKHNKQLVHRSKGLRASKRLAGIHVAHTLLESINLGAKNRSRQRPSINTAVDSMVVPDSDDEQSSRDTS